MIRAATLTQRATDLILGETPSEFTPEKPEVQPEDDPGQPEQGRPGSGGVEAPGRDILVRIRPGLG